uniref:Uncharacterized protein n=1 Tax=Lotus japonicus TaxID=34305 RepID=I3S953_LOTJA|nr:unknown [Lotus japonicus]
MHFEHCVLPNVSQFVSRDLLEPTENSKGLSKSFEAEQVIPVCGNFNFIDNFFILTSFFFLQMLLFPHNCLFCGHIVKLDSETEAEVFEFLLRVSSS